MSERTRALARLAALQGKVVDIAALNLARAEAAQAALTAERTALETLMGRADVTGRLAVLALERARSLMTAEAAADTRRKDRLDERRRAETKLKLAERVSGTAIREDAAHAERRALERLIEEAVGRGQD